MTWLFFGIATFFGALVGLLSYGFLPGAVVGIFAAYAVFPFNRRSLFQLFAYLVMNIMVSCGIPLVFGMPLPLIYAAAAFSTILFALTLLVGRRWVRDWL